MIKDTHSDVETEQEPKRPELDYDPGEIAPCWASPHPDAELSPECEKELKMLVDNISRIDVAARRWEVEQSWEARLYDRGYQYLWPRRGGGWIYIPFSSDSRNRSRYSFYGNETNIYATYGEILTAALTRDIPSVRFSPQRPSSDVDITAKDGATEYSRIFARNNDLLKLHEQLVYYLRTDGRALIVTDHIVDAQQYGRYDPENTTPVVPETEGQGAEPIIYLVRHGETERNRDHQERGRDDVELDDKGTRQIDRAADWLKNKNIRAIVSSPITRAEESALIISQELGLPYQMDDRLASLDLGDFAGQDEQDADEDIAEAFEEHLDEPLAGGESPEQFEQRVQEAILDWSANSDHPLVLVVHDSVISQVFKMFQGDGVAPGSQTDPGWIVALSPNEDGTLDPKVCYPMIPPEISSGKERGKPRGQEVSKAYGKLEHKVPFSAQSGDLADCPWVQVSGEYDECLPKAMFPEKADEIKAGGSVGGESDLDRIARINATLALESNYVTGDSMVRDCTIQRTWMRPAYFMSCSNPAIREELFEKLPDGCLVIQAGGAFVKARNESMDDHCTLIHAFPGTGMNRLALCSKLLSIQKRLNNWMDLIDQYFVKCVPMRYAASGPLDVAAIQNQGVVVGGYVPVLLDKVPPGKSISDLVWMEPYPQAQPLLGEFIKFFATDLPQMLSHALPSLFGAIANTDTATGAVIQRDQALGSLGSPWHNIKCATATYFKQAVQLAARCREQPIEDMDRGGVKTRIEMADLKGNVLCYPEEDSNFPETSTQKEMRWRELAQNPNNPVFARLSQKIENRIEAIKAIGLQGVKDPDEAGYEKQKGEFEILLKTPPAPNPEYTQAAKAVQEAQTRVTQKHNMGAIADDSEIQALSEMTQQLETIPKLLPSIMVRDTDNHEAEAECCLDKINGPAGRRLASGNADEQQFFENLVLHYQAHEAKIVKPATVKDLPRGFSAAVKDLPPDTAAELLTDSGLSTKGTDMVTTKEFTAELKKSSKVGGGSVPGVQQ